MTDQAQDLSRKRVEDEESLLVEVDINDVDSNSNTSEAKHVDQLADNNPEQLARKSNIKPDVQLNQLKNKVKQLAAEVAKLKKEKEYAEWSLNEYKRLNQKRVGDSELAERLQIQTQLYKNKLQECAEHEAVNHLLLQKLSKCRCQPATVVAPNGTVILQSDLELGQRKARIKLLKAQEKAINSTGRMNRRGRPKKSETVQTVRRNIKQTSNAWSSAPKPLSKQLNDFFGFLNVAQSDEQSQELNEQLNERLNRELCEQLSNKPDGSQTTSTLNTTTVTRASDSEDEAPTSRLKSDNDEGQAIVKLDLHDLADPDYDPYEQAAESSLRKKLRRRGSNIRSDRIKK